MNILGQPELFILQGFSVLTRERAFEKIIITMGLVILFILFLTCKDRRNAIVLYYRIQQARSSLKLVVSIVSKVAVNAASSDYLQPPKEMRIEKDTTEDGPASVHEEQPSAFS